MPRNPEAMRAKVRRYRAKKRLTDPEWCDKQRQSRNRARVKWRRDHPEESRLQDRKREEGEAGGRRHCAKKYRLRGEALVAIMQSHGAKFMGRTMVGNCAICGEYGPVHIDHDHKCCRAGKSCGKCVRGLLCRKHNFGLGIFADSVPVLRAAIAYIERYQQEGACLP